MVMLQSIKTKEESMSQTYLVHYTNTDDIEEYKLVEEEAFNRETTPVLEIDGIPIVSILSVQPYL
jgi:hypothetical protein